MPQTNSFIEKREHSRVKVKIPVQYRLVKDKKELEKVLGLHALAKDLSLNGMFIKVERPVKTGDVFALDVFVPDQTVKRVFAFAEVVRITTEGAGIRLLLMPEEDQSALKDYLEKAVPE